jgi:hypothetical protein
MKSSTTRWTLAVAATALLAVPGTSLAQTPPTTAQPPVTAQQPPDATAQAAAPAGQEAARKHLTGARDILSQLSQLPAAAQLSGEARTQVGQLIANFNELITASTDWRASYTKVDANLDNLLGPDNADADKTAAVSTGTAGTAGITGTAGTTGAPTTPIDPAVRAKLVELRLKLKEFERAAGGATAAAPAAATGAQMTPPPQAQTPPQAETPKPAAMGHDEALQHIAAIEAILNANSVPTSATGTSGTPPPPAAAAAATTGPLTLGATQLTELRKHLTELKKLIGEARK